MILIFMPFDSYSPEKIRLAKDELSMSEEKIRKLIESAESGDVDAQYELGILYREQADEKIALLKKNVSSGSRWMRGASAIGESDYFEQLVQDDRKCALAWFACAAKQGHPDAIYCLSECYACGLGTAPHPEKAQELLMQAAEKGLPAAQGDVGIQYYFGKKNNSVAEVEQDFEKAVAWLTKAAENNDSTAQYFLGLCYENGEGVPSDSATARSWYKRSAELGNMNAAEALERLDDKG